MIKLPAEETNSLDDAIYPKLTQDIEVDVVVVGGGITGLSTAYLLHQSGLKVAVLEKHNLSSGTTGGTTGKVTSQHGFKYTALQEHFGEKTARLYGEANQDALSRIATAIKHEKINCSWSRDDNYVYTSDPSNIAKFKNEAKIAANLGLPASFETKLELPFKTECAVKFADQAKFQAKDYVLGLAKAITKGGGLIFENSEVTGFRDGEPSRVKSGEAIVTAKSIVMATKIPAAPEIARITYGFKEYPTTSYIVGSEYSGKLKGMYISPDDNHYSILPLDGYLLIGGENHLPPTGYLRKQGLYQKLADYGAKNFELQKIDFMWRAMDYLPYDGLPLIGKLYPWSKHMYVATGFQKWGLSTSMVAGTILRDLIMGEPNPWASTFNSLRRGVFASLPRRLFRKPL